MECFWHERDEDDPADGDEAERDTESVPYGDFGKAAGDKGAEEFRRENSGDNPLEACCSRFGKREEVSEVHE